MTNAVTNVALSPEQMAQRIAFLERQCEQLKIAADGKLTLKVSEKGALSVYGFGKWPVTLYKQQWEKLFRNRAQIEAFIAANASLLSVKAGQEG